MSNLCSNNIFNTNNNNLMLPINYDEQKTSYLYIMRLFPTLESFMIQDNSEIKELLDSINHNNDPVFNSINIKNANNENHKIFFASYLLDKMNNNEDNLETNISNQIDFNRIYSHYVIKSENNSTDKPHYLKNLYCDYDTLNKDVKLVFNTFDDKEHYYEFSNNTSCTEENSCSNSTSFKCYNNDGSLFRNLTTDSITYESELSYNSINLILKSFANSSDLETYRVEILGNHYQNPNQNMMGLSRIPIYVSNEVLPNSDVLDKLINEPTGYLTLTAFSNADEFLFNYNNHNGLINADGFEISNTIFRCIDI